MMDKGPGGQRGSGDLRRTHHLHAQDPACFLAITRVCVRGLGNEPILDPEEGMYPELARGMREGEGWRIAWVLGTIALTSGLGCRLLSSEVGALSEMILATALGAFLFRRMNQIVPVFAFAVSRPPGPSPEPPALTGARWPYVKHPPATSSTPTAPLAPAEPR